MIEQKIESHWRESSEFFPCKIKFHDSREHFIIIKYTSFKNGVFFHKTKFEIFQQKIGGMIGFFEFLKQAGSAFKCENANVSKN